MSAADKLAQRALQDSLAHTLAALHAARDTRRGYMLAIGLGVACGVLASVCMIAAPFLFSIMGV